MIVNIGITETNRQVIAQELSRILADEHILYMKTKNAHWNIEDSDFYDKHKLFETQFRELDSFIDRIAEHMRSIGHYAPATLKLYLDLTHLTEHTNQSNNSQGFIKVLLGDHESIIIHLRKNIKFFMDEFNDFGTSDFITSLIEGHERTAWILRSHLG